MSILQKQPPHEYSSNMNGSNWYSSDASSDTSSSSPNPLDNLRFFGEDISEPADLLGTKDVFKEVVKGRKSWKTLKGGEMVWPPELEAALLEGLASYQPDDSRETRLLGRFPMRNRYIAAYIHQKTGKVRTAKQVGSRLQQLRDTCSGKKLQHLLSPTRKPTSSGSTNEPDYSSLQRYGLPAITNKWRSSKELSPGPGPTPPIPDDGPWSIDQWAASNGPSLMYIDLLPKDCIHSPVHSSHHDLKMTIGADTKPRPINTIDPTLTFNSPSLLDTSACSAFKVFDSSGFVIHTEKTPLTLVNKEKGYFYSTSLIPRLWEEICRHDDPTEFTIQHDVTHDNPTGPSNLYTAFYKFRYPSARQGTRVPARVPSPLDFDIFQKQASLDSTSELEYDISPTSTQDVFDLSDLGLPNPPSFDASSYSSLGRSASLPNTPRLDDRELYQSRRGSDPSCTWSTRRL